VAGGRAAAGVAPRGACPCARAARVAHASLRLQVGCWGCCPSAARAALCRAISAPAASRPCVVPIFWSGSSKVGIFLHS
jgi:hypothetical protein